MGIINQISNLINVILVVLFIGSALVMGLGYYFLKIKKVTSKQERLNYNNFERRDSMEYVKFDNVLSGSSFGRDEDEGIFVTENDTAFTAGVRIRGYSFYNASAQEQSLTMQGMMNFLHTVDRPIQLRQTSKAIDITHTTTKYTDRINELTEEIQDGLLRLDELKLAAVDYEDEPDMLMVYIEEMKRVEKDLSSLQYQVQSLEYQNSYLKSIASGKYDSEIVSTLFVTWKFRDTDYVQELTKEEVYLKAFTELATSIDIFTAALARCQCRCSRLSASELVDMCRRHYHPRTGDMVELSDLVGTSLDSLFISSDSLLELEKEAMEEREFARMMAAIEDDREEAVERSEMKSDRYIESIQDDIREQLKGYNPFAGMED